MNYSYNYRLRITATGEQEYVTSGPGLEQSVLNALFDEYFATREFEFCTPIWDAYTTLITLPQTASAHISDAKKEELTIFGAVTALALIYGHYPGHLNPLLLIYLLNDSKLQSLHRDLVFQYFPSLGLTLDEWLHIGPNDDVQQFASHFASYHNIQVSWHFTLYSCS